MSTPHRFLLLLSLAAPLAVNAAVAPALIRLVSNTNQYLETFSVPTNKTLVIDAIQFDANQGTTSDAIEIIATNGTILILDRLVISGNGSWYNGGLLSLNRSIKIPTEAELRAQKTKGSGNTNSACIYGCLVDSTDLYASAKFIDITPLIEGNKIQLSVCSGAIQITRIERSETLQADGWTPIATLANDVSNKRDLEIPTRTTTGLFFRQVPLAQ